MPESANRPSISALRSMTSSRFSRSATDCLARARALSSKSNSLVALVASIILRWASIPASLVRSSCFCAAISVSCFRAATTAFCRALRVAFFSSEHLGDAAVVVEPVGQLALDLLVGVVDVAVAGEAEVAAS